MVLLSAFRQRNPIIYFGALAFGFGALIMLLLMAIDNTQILGINRWIKPFKFFISVAIYFITFCWLSGDLPNRRFVRIFSYQIILSMGVEITAIVSQAIRGEKSHFNFDNPTGAIIFAIMGIFILYNTLWIFIFTYRYFKTNLSDLPQLYVLSARLGLLIFLVGNLLGGYMSQQSAHTVGAPDGGPGLPLVNWSTGYGDLRIAHFLGLHGLQLLLLLGFFLSSSRFPKINQRRIIWIAFLATLAFVFLTFWEAVQGIPLIKA